MKRRSVAYKSSWTTWPKGMRDVIRWKHAALLALALLAAGCSSNSKKELPPAELTDFKEEVVLKKQWSRSIGDGQGETYNMLVPAIDGDTIYAAADGQVVYAADGLKEYGNLVLVKHIDGYITAYAHNSKMLVKSGDNVVAGQKIAEMGSSGTTQTMLEFQVRLDGKPINPANILPIN